jgi:Protein of unknown function (DUF1236)
MKSKLLMMSTVALLAGTLAAAGQSIQPGGGTQEKGASSGPGQSSQPSKEQSGKELKAAPNRNAQSSQGTRGEAAGKEPSSTSGQAKSKESPTTSGQAKGKEAPTTNGQAPGGRDEDRAQRDQDKKPQGQTQRDQDRPRTGGQAPRDQDRQGQIQRDQDRQPGQTQRQGQTERDQDRTQQGEREGQRSGNTNVSVSFTTEQRTRIRETVFKESSAPRVSSVNFSITEGTVVPRTVHIIEVPDVIVQIHPEWRGYRYFIVKEELVIVEPDTLRIVAIIDV